MGRPNFTCCMIARRMRTMGFEVAETAEEEQSLVIWTMLELYKLYGKGYHNKMNEFLKNRTMNEPVRIFKCPCEGNKYKLAGEPNDNPTPEEKAEYDGYVAAGCTVLYITIEQFRSENWQWCPKHF